MKDLLKRREFRNLAKALNLYGEDTRSSSISHCILTERNVLVSKASEEQYLEGKRSAEKVLETIPKRRRVESLEHYIDEAYNMLYGDK